MKVWTLSGCTMVESWGRGVKLTEGARKKKDDQTGPPKELGDAYMWEVGRT